MRVSSIQEIFKSENRKKREYSKKKIKSEKENKESFSKVLKFEIEKWKGEK